jgi:hypothetical protein
MAAFLDHVTREAAVELGHVQERDFAQEGSVTLRWQWLRDMCKPLLYGLAAISLRWGLYRHNGDVVGWKLGLLATIAMLAGVVVETALSALL